MKITRNLGRLVSVLGIFKYDYYKSKNGYVFKRCTNCKRIKPYNFNHFNRKYESISAKCKGCCNIKYRKYYEKTTFERRRDDTIRRARKLGIPCLKYDELLDYIHQLNCKQNGHCFYTGIIMRRVSDYKAKGANDLVLSLDRLDPSKGYVKGNIVLCCLYVNRIKHSKTYDQFMIYIEPCEIRYRKARSVM